MARVGVSIHVWKPLDRVAALTVMLVIAVGCSDGRPERVPISGTVLVDGKPINKGNIMFVPDGGRPASGKIQEDGSFILGCFEEDDGALVGLNRVAVSAKTIISESNIEWYAPAHYSNHKTSGITVEVTEPVDDLVIELTSQPEERPRR